MDTLIGLTLLCIPLGLAAIYSYREYGLSLLENFEKWRIGKVAAVCILAIYIFYVAVSEVAFSILYIEEWAFYFVYPGISVSLIVYSKPASEFLSDYSSLKKADMHEDVAFVLGYAWLLYITWAVWLHSFL